ncbi:MAG TPA: hypothetical protein VMF65_09975, partial [Acidimicrobiales bacterium]|nr:hypothetical protein [Acidimicrobiales bacterium]
QLRTYGIGLILGLAAVGYVQAASTLMGPFMVVFFGFGLLALPEAVRLLRTSPRHLLFFCVVLGIGLALLGLAWGAILLVALPMGAGQLLLHSLWRPTYPLILPLTISIMGGCVMASAGTGLHALGAARRSLRAMVISSVIYVIFSLAGAVAGGAVGTVSGAAVASWLSAVVFWWQFRVALLSPEAHVPASSPEVDATSASVEREPELAPPYLRPGTPAISPTSLHHAPAATVRLASPVEPLSTMAVDFTGGGVPMPKVAAPDPDGFEEYSGPMVDISSLRHVARRGRKAWVAAALAGLVLGAAFHLFVPAKYAAVTDLYMVEPAGADPTAAIANDVSLLETRAVAEQAVKALHLDVSPSTFLATYQGTSVSNEILSVKLSATSPGAAVTDANAVARAFLSVRSAELALQTQLVVHGLAAQVNSLNGQIKSLTRSIGSLSVAKAGPQSANQVAALVDQRTNDASQITELQSQEQQDFLTEQTAVQGSHVLDPAVAEKTSDTKVVAEDALTGLVGGLLLGLGIVLVAGVISDRPRLRHEVAAALGVPVELSVGPYRPPLLLRQARLRRSVRRPRGTLEMMARRVYNQLEAAPGSALAVLPIGPCEPAALCVSSLALSLAAEGKRVVLVDMADRRPLWQLVRGRGQPSPHSSIIFQDEGVTLVVAPADPAEMPPMVADDADFVIVLASVSPALGVEQLAAWASTAVVFVTAGKVTDTLMASSTELVRQAGLTIRSAVLVGATPDDDSTGTLTGQTPMATTVGQAPSSADGRLKRADERVAPMTAIVR